MQLIYMFLFGCFGFAASAPPTVFYPWPINAFPDDTRIVGGHDIDISEAPYQVSIVSWGSHTCGGSIIAEDLVLTAAHCVFGASSYGMEVRVGSSSSRTGGKLIKVADLIWHQGFSYSKMDNDVALLWLSEPLEFDEKVAAIELDEQDYEIDDGEETFVTGWGNTREGGGTPTTLQKVGVPKVSQAACSEAYHQLYKITNNMLCAGIPSGGKDACQGDSGGPLAHNGKLSGVVSWGIGCARPQYPGVYAKVSALRQWIDKYSHYIRYRNVIRRDMVEVIVE